MSKDAEDELKLLKALTQDKLEKLRRIPPAQSKKEAKVMRAVKRDPGRGTRN